MTEEINYKHSNMVASLFKPGEDILLSLTPEKCVLLHAAVGVSGEAGELLDAVKKHVMYNKELDRENIIEELGDLEFYLEAVRQTLGLSRDAILDHNHHKLTNEKTGRYKDGIYSDVQAITRLDKQTPQQN